MSQSELFDAETLRIARQTIVRCPLAPLGKGQAYHGRFPTNSQPEGDLGNSRRSRSSDWIIALVAVAAAFMAPGCTPSFYRRQADAEAHGLVAQKANDPRWPLEGYHVYTDPQSRMYDPNDPDCEPMPLDDPTSHELMHSIDGMKGYKTWHAQGDTPYVENPCWLNSLPVNEEGELVVDADSAVELALLHSPDYQEELENLYLSALDVSFERFRFDTQFFGGYESIYSVLSRNHPDAAGRSRSLLDASTRDVEARRLLATGGELVVGLANSIVWQFAGPNENVTTSLLDFSLIQPLLRRAGRNVVLERLTIAERGLLANVRQMERFRRGFYVEIVTGSDAGPGPTRRGGVFGGAGLEGFTGVGSGGFGRVGGFGATGFVGAGAGAGQAGGFFGLLQERQGIRNQESTIASLRNSLAQLEAYYAAGRIDFLQVQQAREALFTAQSQLLIARTAYQSSLDSFKSDLGLPPQLELEIDDSFVRSFNLIDESMVSIQDRLTALQQSVGRTIVGMLPPEPEVGRAQLEMTPLPWTREMAAELRSLQTQLVRAEQIRSEVVDENLAQAWQDIDRLRESLSRRRQNYLSIRQRLATPAISSEAALAAGEAQTIADDAGLGLMEPAELEQLPGQLETMLTDLKGRFDRMAETLLALDQKTRQLLREGPTLDPEVLSQRLQFDILAPVPNELTELSAEVLELLLVQARARTETITLVNHQLASADAFEIARVNRRDWMNARANLVDTWRLISFNANDLKSDLDIVFSGDVRNIGDNPVDFRSSTGRLRVGLEFDAPLTRLAERNRYRQALIEYQQARRNYYQFADRIARGLRDTTRTLELNQINFELRRAAVQVAIAQVELARLRLQEPPKPEEEATFGPTTARDLVQALSALLSAQNDFLSVFVNYEVLRRTLDFNLGTMELDARGVWIDPGPVMSDNSLSSAPPRPMDPEPIGPGEPVFPEGSATPPNGLDELPLTRPDNSGPMSRPGSVAPTSRPPSPQWARTIELTPAVPKRETNVPRYPLRRLPPVPDDATGFRGPPSDRQQLP